VTSEAGFSKYIFIMLLSNSVFHPCMFRVRRTLNISPPLHSYKKQR
jgi:hypothetical protein